MLNYQKRCKMEKELTKKQQEIQQKKELIFRTSVELFKQYGYDNVSIKDICTATNISTGSLYNMFKNKAAILYQFKDLFTHNCYDTLRANMNSENGIETIISYITAILETFDYIGKDITLKLHLSHNLLFPQVSEGAILLEKHIECLKEKKIISTTLSAAQCVDMIHTIIYGYVYHWCLYKGEYDLLGKAKKDLPDMLSFLKYE